MKKKRLYKLYRQIAFLTWHHAEADGHAVVSASVLGKALAEVDENWWHDMPQRRQEKVRLDRAPTPKGGVKP